MNRKMVCFVYMLITVMAFGLFISDLNSVQAMRSFFDDWSEEDLSNDVFSSPFTGFQIDPQEGESINNYQSNPHNPEAQWRLGEIYRRSPELGRNDEDIRSCYERASSAGYAPAQHSLGDLCSQNRAGLIPAEAMDFYCSAAKRGYTPSLMLLAEVYKTGRRFGDTQVIQNFYGAIRLYGLAMQQRDNTAHGELENLYARDNHYGLVTGSRTGLESIEKIRVAREQFNLAKLYQDAPLEAPPSPRPAQPGVFRLYGRPRVRDLEKAERLYSFAACNGNCQAFVKLAKLCEQKGRESETIDLYREAIHFYKCAKNDTEALASLGQLYEQGRGIDQDDDQAATFYLEAVKYGHAESEGHILRLYQRRSSTEEPDSIALFKLGLLYEKGSLNKIRFQIIQKDESMGKRYYRNARARGYPGASRRLGRMHEKGIGGSSRSDEKAFKYYKEGSENGDLRSTYLLGMLFKENRGLGEWERKWREDHPYDSQENIDRTKRLAELNYFKQASCEDAKADFQYALILERGDFSSLSDHEDYRAHYLRAANAGYALAQHRLGELEEQESRGRIQEFNPQWYQRSAAQDYAPALCSLGRMYQTGCQGIEVNELQAMQLLQRAADKGNLEGMYRLGLMYERGGRWGQSFEEALRIYYRLHGEHNYAPAQCRLGVIYQAGCTSIPKDQEKAKAFYQAAARIPNDNETKRTFYETLARQKQGEYFLGSAGAAQKIIIENIGLACRKLWLMRDRREIGDREDIGIEFNAPGDIVFDIYKSLLEHKHEGSIDEFLGKSLQSGVRLPIKEKQHDWTEKLRALATIEGDVDAQYLMGMVCTGTLLSYLPTDEQESKTYFKLADLNKHPFARQHLEILVARGNTDATLAPPAQRRRVE